MIQRRAVLGMAMAMAALAIVALPFQGLAQGEEQAQDVPEGVVSPGPLGRPYSQWADEWHAIWRPVMELPEAITLEDADPDEVEALDCAQGDRGDVFYLSNFSGAECTVTSGQSIVILIASIDCDYHPSKKKRDDAERRSQAYSCLMAGSVPLSDPFLSVDGEEVAVDERFLVLTPVDEAPFEEGSEVTTHRSWVMMLEPLSVGRHTVEHGVTAEFSDEGPEDIRVTTDVEVVAGAT